MVQKAIEGGNVSIESGLVTKKEKKLIAGTAVALWDALNRGPSIDQYKVIETAALWMMDLSA